MLQMMTDTTCIAHSRCGYNHFRFLDKIDHLGIIARCRYVKPGKYKRIYSGIDKLHCLFIKTIPHIHCKYFRRFDRQRTIQVHVKIFVFRKQMLFFDLTDKIKHLLCPSDCKGRNDNITSSVKCLLDNAGKLSQIIRFLGSMYPVSVSRLHYDIICQICVAWIFYDRLIYISDIPRKDDLLRHITFCCPDFDTGRSKQMSDIGKTNLYPIADRDPFPIPARHEQFNRIQRILHHIHGLKFRFSCPSAFPVSPFCLKLLNMSAVTKHDIT